MKNNSSSKQLIRKKQKNPIMKSINRNNMIILKHRKEDNKGLRQVAIQDEVKDKK